MSEGVDRRKRRLSALAAGTVAGVLYGTLALSPAFLAPLQAAKARGGFRAFLIAAGVALLVCMGFAYGQFTALGVPFGALNLLQALLFPLALAAGLALVNLPALARLDLVYRLLLGALVASSGAIPVLIVLFSAGPTEDILLKAFEMAAKSVGERSGAQVLELEPAALVEAIRLVVANGFAAAIFLVLFANYWIGERFGSAGTVKQDRSRLADFRVPSGLLWPFLASWALVLGSRFLRLPVLGAIAWNVSLAFSVTYGVQGLSILGRLALRFVPPPLRIAGTFLMVFLAISPATGWLVAIALPALGLSETWVPYRTTKEITDEGHPEQ